MEEVQFHLFRNGIDLSYTKWNKHGEKDEPSISAPKPVNATTEFKDDKDLTACQTCGISRWKVDNKTHKVYEKHFSKDSQAWRTIDEKFPEIAKDLRNLQLGISADGVDVNTGNRHHSVWPVLTVIYNLPPWLCMKRKFI
ncbi:glutamate receptor 2.8-like protein, partial [Tanacetum coccineum]